MLDSLLGILAPHPCSGCGNLGRLLCPQCKYDIISDPFERCLVCLHPAVHGNLCDRCRLKTKLMGAWCVGEREKGLQELLNRYKFSSAREAAHICASLLDETLPVLTPDITVVPVPTAPAHRRQRGFDHTADIARRFAAIRQLHYTEVLDRHGNTTQHFMNRADRMKYVRQAIRSNGPAPAEVLLLDDIYTTGATVRACLDVLRSAGAERVYVAVIARQTLDENK